MADGREPDEYSTAVSSIENAFRDALKAYVKWHAKNWTMTREQWDKSTAGPPPTGDYFDGYNAGIEAAKDSIDAFLDEFHS